MDISNNLSWRSNFLDNNWLGSKDVGYLICKLNDMLSFARELTSWFDVLALLWLQQRLNEHLAKSVIRVFINLSVVLILRVQLLRFFGEFVDRDLSDDQREIFRLDINLVRLDLRGSDMSLVRELKLSLHIVVVLSVLLDTLLLIFITFFSIFLWRLDFLKKVVVSSKQLLSVNLANLTQRDVWNFMLKSSVDINIVARGPARMSKSLDRVEFVPFR